VDRCCEFFFFSSSRRHTRFSRDWSSDVCSSDLTGRYQDIEDSDLPEAVKNLLRMIRDLRAKLAQLMRELRAVQADDSMNPEARRIRLQQIQAQMSALNGALIAATQKLAALMRDIRLGKEQQMAAAQLALR